MSSSWGTKRICEIGSIVEERVRKTNPTFTDHRPYVALEHIASNRTRLIGWSVASDALSAKSEFKKGDILFGKLRPNLQKCVVAPFEGVCSTDILVLYPKKGVTPEFLPHLLRSGHVMSYVTRTATGTKMPRTSWSSLETCSVKIPSENNQKKIATFLDSLDKDIEATRLLAQQAARLKSALAQDLLVHAMQVKRSPVHSAKLGQLFSERTERGRPGLPTISVTMNDGIMDREEMDRRIDSALTPGEHLLAKTGDIAYNMMRMWQGVSGLVPQDSLVSPAYVVVTPGPNIDACFAAHFFKLPETIRLFRRYSQGLTDDRLRLYFHQFAEIPVTIPKKVSDQKRIARLLDTMDEAAAQHESTLAALIRAKTAISNEIFCSS